MEELKKINGGKDSLFFNGKEVHFNPALFYFAEIESRFAPVIEKTQSDIEKKYQSNLSGMGDYIANIDSFLAHVFDPLINFSIKQLSLLGCYDFDRNSFFEKYVSPKFDELLAIKKHFIAEEKRIDNAQEARNEMRTDRRHAAEDREIYSKDRENATLTHGAFNLLARGVDALGNTAERNNIYNSKKEKIKNELNWICYDMVGSVAQAIYKSTGFDIRDPRSADDYQKAENIFKNISAGNVSSNHLEQAALDVFSCNPAEEGFLAWCVSQYSDPNGDFETAAQIFHVDLAATKRKILKNMVKLDTEEEAIASKERYLQGEKKLSFKFPELLKMIDDALVKFDLEARTVNGVEFKTREEAVDARIQLKKLEGIMSSGSSATEDGTKTLIAQIEENGLTVCFAENVKKELKKKLVKFDLEARTVNGVEFKTREEAVDARIQLKKMNEILQKGDLKTEEGTQSVLNDLENSGLDAFFVVDKKKELKDALIQFDLDFRTVDEVEYKTREEAALARKELESLNNTISKYKLDNPDRCNELLKAIAALNFKTNVAEKTVKRVEQFCKYQIDKIAKIQKKYNFSVEDATVLFTKYSALSRSGISGLKIFDLVDINTGEYATNFKIPQNEIIIGYLDLYQNQGQGLLFTDKGQGLLFTDKGIYARFVPIWKSKMVTRIAGFVAGPILGFIIKEIGLAVIPFFEWIINFLIFVSPFVVLIFHHRIFQKLDSQCDSIFTPWNEVILELSMDKKILSLSGNNKVVLPSNAAVVNQFRDFQTAVSEQQKLASKVGNTDES